MRLGLRYVKGLPEEIGRQMEAEQARAPFVSVGDLVARAGLDREETARLAEIGALRSLGLERQAAPWAAARALRSRGALYPAVPNPPFPSPPPPAMMTRARLVADYMGTGLTLGPHPMQSHRRRLSQLGGPARGICLTSPSIARCRWQPR